MNSDQILTLRKNAFEAICLKMQMMEQGEKFTNLDRAELRILFQFHNVCVLEADLKRMESDHVWMKNGIRDALTLIRDGKTPLGCLPKFLQMAEITLQASLPESHAD